MGVMVGCAPVRQIKPLPMGVVETRASLGGPLIHFGGAVIPIPFTSVGIDYGVRRHLTLGGTIYPTAWLFGAFQMDMHALYALYVPSATQSRGMPGVSLGAAINYTVERWAWRQGIWPEIDFNCWWQLGKRTLAYGGIGNWFELRSKRSHGQPQQYHWIWNPHLGVQWQAKRFHYQVEVKALAPFAPNDEVVVDYLKPFGRRGAMGIYVSVAKRWPKSAQINR